MMKNIYIILTYTGTILSKLIKIYSKDEFCHVSIALDRQLNEMYSFGRLNPYNPFNGGFVHEGIHKGTFKRFYKTIAKIYCLEITEEQYKSVEQKLFEIKQNKQKYKFNTLGLFAVSLRIKRKKQNYFYCAEFIKYILEYSKIYNGLPELIRPEDFKNIPEAKEIYHGLLNRYDNII